MLKQKRGKRGEDMAVLGENRMAMDSKEDFSVLNPSLFDKTPHLG